MKKGYACFLGLSVVCILALSSVTVSAQNSKIRSDLSRSFKKFDLVRPDGARDEGSVRSLRLRAAGRDHQLVLSQNDMFAANYKAEDMGSFGTREIERPAVNTYKGRVTGDDRSEVRLTIDESGIEGFFDVGGERYFVEPARRYSDAASVDQTVIYKEEDSLNTETFYCAADLPGRIAVGESLLNQNTAQAILASRNLEIATEADLQYVTILGGAAQANANITSILNMVEGTYTSELDLEITITFQHTWSTADPFAGANSGDILMNFLNYWDTNYPRSSYPRDTAHMFSGKSNILSAGIAFVGAVCYTPQYAYGVSGYFNPGTGDQSIYIQITRGPARRDHAIPKDTTPTVFAMCTPITPPDSALLARGVSVVTLEDIRWKYCHIKAITLLPNVLLRADAAERGADDAILLRDGMVTEGTASNVFLWADDQLITPPKSPHLLPGITRDLLLEIALQHGINAFEQDLTEHDLRAADEIWLTSSTKEILPVTQLNGEPVGAGKPGGRFRTMLAWYQEYKRSLRANLPV